MYVELNLPEDTLMNALESLSREDFMQLMVKMDLLIADVEFTEELIKKLVTSLKADRADTDLPFIDWDKV